jgi:hypothetical protein
MRVITDHKVNGLNESIIIDVRDQPGHGGANHVYAIDLAPPGRPTQAASFLSFQNGPISTPDDMNGITNESIIAVAIDRMRGFQYERNLDGTFNFNSRGKYACKENAQALTYLEEALMWLQKRTLDRMRRGVEGTHAV